MKYGFMVKPVAVLRGIPISAPLLIGVALYGTSFLLNFYVIKTFNLSYAIPVGLGTVYIIIISASYFFFRESITLVQFIGILMVLLGVIIINIKP